MTEVSSWFLRRLGKNVKRREKRVEKFLKKIEHYKARHAAGKITRAQYQQKLMEYETKVRQTRARIQTYQGAMGKERRRLEEFQEHET